MSRQKGSGKEPGSGRQKGTRNKDSVPLHNKAKELGIDPFEILLYFAKGDWKALGYLSGVTTRIDKNGGVQEIDTITSDQRLRAATEACQYIHPKLKAIEHSSAKGEASIQSQLIILPSNGREVKSKK